MKTFILKRLLSFNENLLCKTHGKFLSSSDVIRLHGIDVLRDPSTNRVSHIF